MWLVRKLETISTSVVSGVTRTSVFMNIYLSLRNSPRDRQAGHSDAVNNKWSRGLHVRVTTVQLATRTCDFHWKNFKVLESPLQGPHFSERTPSAAPAVVPGLWFSQSKLLGDGVALRTESRTSDREVAGSTPARVLLRNNLRQVVHALCSISWYRLWKRCGLPSITLSVSSLHTGSRPRKRRWTPHPYVTSAVRGRWWLMGHFTAHFTPNFS